MSTEYALASLITIVIVVGFVAFLAIRDLKKSYEIKDKTVDRYM